MEQERRDGVVRSLQFSSVLIQSHSASCHALCVILNRVVGVEIHTKQYSSCIFENETSFESGPSKAALQFEERSRYCLMSRQRNLLCRSIRYRFSNLVTAGSFPFSFPMVSSCLSFFEVSYDLC